MTDSDEELIARVREGIYVPESHLANGFAITRHDEVHAALDAVSRRLEELKDGLRYVAGIQDGCCGKATKPEYACIHDRARSLLHPEPQEEEDR